MSNVKAQISNNSKNQILCFVIFPFVFHLTFGCLPQTGILDFDIHLSFACLPKPQRRQEL